MASADTRYPILVDTDTLIAVANSSLWTQITKHVGLTTTNVCKQELKRHIENTRETAPEGSRPTGFITGAVLHLMRSKMTKYRSLK